MAEKYKFDEAFLNAMQFRIKSDQQRDEFVQDMAYKTRQQSLYEKFQMQDYLLNKEKLQQGGEEFQQKLTQDQYEFEKGLGLKEQSLQQDESQFNRTLDFKERQLRADTGLGYARLNEQRNLNSMTSNKPIDFTKIDNMIWKDYYGLQNQDITDKEKSSGLEDEQIIENRKLTWREDASKETLKLLEDVGIGQDVIDKIWSVSGVTKNDNPKTKREKLKNVISQISGQLNNSQVQALYRMAEVRTR